MAFLNKENYSKICRLCTSSLGMGPYRIFDEDFSHELLQKIADCLPIKVVEEDDLPKSVCRKCVQKLDDFHNFRESCIRSSRLLETSQIKGNGRPALKMLDPNESSSGNDSQDGDGQLVICEIDENQPTNGGPVNSDDDDSEFLRMQSIIGRSKVKKLPELGEPCSEDYVLMKEETFNIDTKDKGASNILADYLVEFNNNSHDKEAIKDKDIFESQKLRKEVLPPMWDVYEKTINNADDDGKPYGVVQVTHRRYIVSKGAFPCSLCGECFEFNQGRGRDEIDDKNRLFDCHVCGKVFPRRSSWKRHQSTHEDMKPYVCRICGYGFNRREHLSRHLLSHTNTKPFNCEGCGKLFTRKEHLARHHLCSPSCISGDGKDTFRPFCCEVCGHGFVRKEHLLRHRKKNHDLDPPESAEPKPFTCEVCHKTFTRREHLRRHQIIHTRDLILNSSSYNLSLMTQPNQEKPINSEVSLFQVFPDQSQSNQLLISNTCETARSSSGDELSHMDQTTPDQKSDGPNDDAKIDTETDDGEDTEDHLPPLPQVSLEIENTLLDVSAEVKPDVPATSHIPNVPKPNPLRLSVKTECDICNKNFSRRSHLLRHLKRIHHVNLPTRIRRKREPGPGDENGNSLVNEENTSHSCDLCGRTFNKRYLLERHQEQQHTSEIARYECVTCGMKFVESHLLDEHMAAHGNSICDNFIWM